MNGEEIVAGFIGAGGIAVAHAFALDSIKYYYNNYPGITLESVCSATEHSRNSFSERFGFRQSQNSEEFLKNDRIDTVYILGPNKVHYEYFEAVFRLPSLRRIYIEKPICTTLEEEKNIFHLAEKHPEIRIQVGFQYLFSSQIMGALNFWRSGRSGNPIHFDLKYYHGDYLDKDYRIRRASRLTPAPDGGAMADLGSHAISILIAFLGDKLQIINALQAGHFSDVAVDSDLFSLINLIDQSTKAVGTLSASRISSGTGDMISFELYSDKGVIKFSTNNPDYFEYYLEESGVWTKELTGSNYKPLSTFPSGHVPPGWLRSMIHAQYVFITGKDYGIFVPDMVHGLAVQKIIRQTADHMNSFRMNI